MDYVALLKRAFHITIKYRALWIFGFFLALCSGSGSGGGGGQNFRTNGGFGRGGFGEDGFGEGGFGELFGSVPEIAPWLIGGFVAAVICLILLLVVLGIVVRAVTRTALIGMVDRIEETGAVTIGQGWAIGWSKRALNVFLISVIIFLPLTLLFAVLLLAALSPFALIAFDNTGLLILGIIAGIGLLLLWIFAVILVNLLVSPFSELSWRYAALRNLGPLDSLKESYALIRANLKVVAIIILLLIGVGLAWALINFILTIVAGLVGLIAGSIPGLLAFLLTREWWAAFLAGLPPFLIVVILALTVANGLYLIFRSAIWTLVFRALTPAGDVPAEPGLAEKSVGEESDGTDAGPGQPGNDDVSLSGE